jgi:hypothetical protein
MTLSAKEYNLILWLYLLLTIAVIILIVQFFRIRTFRRYFRELSSVFSKDVKIDYASLVEMIIRSKELYTPGPSLETMDIISSFIRRIIDDTRVFIHVTSDKIIAENIIHDGFKYAEDFSKSTEEISSDLSDLAYKLQIYRPYGKFVIIICLPRDLTRTLKSSPVSESLDLLAEHGISEYHPEDELNYRLPPHFVCGYIDIENQTITENKLFRNY